ncbi:MAG: class I SAM-dependent methyltransferase [Turicibacter sp.]|nr:class I SAM-dependent methyltransferase [Turicibacter sp.]
MAYHAFSYYYDILMQDVPYYKWVAKTKKHLPIGSHILDVGCGTGTLSLLLAKEGYQVTGVDLSEDMLALAHEKSIAAGIPINFVHQDMSRMTGFSGFDGAVIYVDSLNYLQKDTEVFQTFRQLYESLNEGGILIFDVHSLLKVTETFHDYLYADTDPALTYIWHVGVGRYPYSIIHELTFFKKTETGYARFQEIHEQRTFAIEEYAGWLEDAGFSILEISADFLDGPVREDAERVIFVAKK